MARLEQQFRETTNRRNAIAPEIERLGEQRARLLADNIELDQQSGACWPSRSPRWKRASTRWPSQDAAMREALRAGEEELKALRAAVQEAHEKRSQIEVELVRKQAELKFLDETSRKELNCAGGGTGRRRTSPCPDADAIAEAEQAANEVRNRIEGAGRGESPRPWRNTRKRSSARIS